MVLDWLGGAQDPAQLIAKGKHAKAVEVLRAQLAKAAGDQRLRLMLADALAGAGRVDDAVPVLLELADDLAASGQAAKAIATLKKVEKLAPRRRDVDVKLAQLINQKNRPAPKWTPVEYESAGSVFSEDHFKAQETDYSPEARIAAAKGATWVPDTGQAAPRSEAPPAPAEEEPAIEILPDDAIRAEEDFRGQILSVFQEALHAPAPPAPAAPPPSTEFKESPLFSSFSADELVAVIRGLVLLSFEPGDIVLTEGDPGDSLFVLTTGSVKAFVHLPGGGQKLVRRMGEGDFFGEISILSGKPRTATVTATTHCELLELDRETLDGICKDHPNVRQVLEDFYVARASGSPS